MILKKVGESESLKKLQKTVGYKVIINYDKPKNLDVKFPGPIKIKKVSSKEYEVTLNLLGSEEAFNNWSQGKSKPYKISFNVIVKDIKNPSISITKTGEFTFNKWSDEVKNKLPNDTLFKKDRSKDN